MATKKSKAKAKTVKTAARVKPAVKASKKTPAVTRAVKKSATKKTSSVKAAAPAKVKKPAKVADKPVKAVVKAAPVKAPVKAKAPAKPVKATFKVEKAVQKQPAAPVPAPVPAKPAKLDFTAGDFVVYPAHGVGQVEGVETQNIAGMEITLYTICFEKDRMRLKLPVTKVKASGLRKLSSKDRLKDALSTLQGRSQVRRIMWSRRAQE